MTHRRFVLLLVSLLSAAGWTVLAWTTPLTAAGPTLTLVVPTVAPVGGPIDVQVRVTGAANLAGWEFDLEYDATLVQIVGLTAAPSFGAGEFACKPQTQRCAITLGPLDQSTGSQGKSSVGAASYGQGSGVSGEAILATLHLQPTGRGGETLLHLSNARVVDTAGAGSVPTTEDAALSLDNILKSIIYLPVIDR